MPRSRSKFRLRSSKLSTSLSQLDSMSTLSTSGAVSTTRQNCASQDKKTNQQNHNVLLSAMLKSVVVNKQVRIGTVFGPFARSNLSFLQTRGFTFFHSHSVRRVLKVTQIESRLDRKHAYTQRENRKIRIALTKSGHWGMTGRRRDRTTYRTEST